MRKIFTLIATRAKIPMPVVALPMIAAANLSVIDAASKTKTGIMKKTMTAVIAQRHPFEAPRWRFSSWWPPL
jgi:hypothetical protein